MNKMRTLTAEKHPIYDEPVRPLPSFSLTEKELPEIKDWKVGEKYTLMMEVEQVSASKDEYSKGPLTARFKICKIGEKEMLTEAEKEGRKGRY
jgi:hypothetical protein